MNHSGVLWAKEKGCTGVQAVWAALGIHSRGTRPAWDWASGRHGLGPDIVSHLKPVVMTCKY